MSEININKISIPQEIKLWSLKNYHSNINRTLGKIFNNIRFIYTYKRKRRYCWYKNYQKKSHIRALKYKNKLYSIAIKKSYKFIFYNNIKKKFIKNNIKPWSYFGKHFKKRINKLIHYQNNFNKSYNRNNLCILLKNHPFINIKKNS